MTKPELCSVYDEEFIGENATKEDLHRFWKAFDILLHNHELLEDLKILNRADRDDPEDVPQAIDNWLWDDGNWGHRLEQILGDIGYDRN